MLALLSSILEPNAADTVQLSKDELDVCWCIEIVGEWREAHPQTA